MGLVTLICDLLTLRLAHKSHERWGTFVPNLGMLGLWVLKSFAMYVTDGETDRQTDGRKDKSKAYCPLPYGWGIKITHVKLQPTDYLEFVEVDEATVRQLAWNSVIEAQYYV